MEAVTLSVAGQTMMDMYYRDFKQSGDFFDIDHFIYLARAIWGKMLENEATEWRKVNKQETGYYTIDIPGEWLVTEEVEFIEAKPIGEMKGFVGELKDAPFAFKFDKWSWGIQAVFSDDSDDFERITVDGRWKLKNLPFSKKIWYYTVQNKINVYSWGEIKNVTVNYLPSLTNENADTVILPIGKLLDIATIGYNVMVQVKQGGVIDKTNNLNPNATMQSEIDNVLAGIRTKQVPG